MASRSPSRGRSRSQTAASQAHPRSRYGSHSRTPSSHGDQSLRHNGDRRGYSRGISRSRSRTPRSQGGRGRSLSPSRSPLSQSTKIVVEKLTKSVIAGHLQEIFSTYGRIVELDMPIHAGFNMNRGLAYIVYESTAGAESAIAHMHEAWLDGEQISVSIVLPRKRWSRSPPLRREERGRRGPPGGPAPFRDARGDFDRGPPLPRNSYRERDYDRPPPPSFRDRGPPPRGPPGGYRSPLRRRSPPPPLPPRAHGGGPYRGRSFSRSRSPVRRGRSWSRNLSRERGRSRSKSWSSRSPSRSRSPPPRRGGGGGSYGGRRPSPPRGGPPRGGGGGRRSPSYDSYSSYTSRSRSRDRGGRRR